LSRKKTETLPTRGARATAGEEDALDGAIEGLATFSMSWKRMRRDQFRA